MFPGRIIANRYRVLRVLGRGGMGVVSEVEQLDNGERFAIKFLREDVESDMQPNARFMREAKLATRLTSPHSCRVLSIGEWELGPYIVMELLDGRPLNSVLERGQKLNYRQAVRVAYEMCDALSEAHQLGIVHRDVKPGNVYLTKGLDGRVTTKVLDFGVAKIPGSVVTQNGEPSLTDASTLLGTPSYVAPEQLMNSKLVDARADVWAVGVMLYEMLSGHLPFASPLIPKLLVMIAKEEPAPLAALSPDSPIELVQIVHRCLFKAPALRHADAAKLAEALKPWLDPSRDLLLPLLKSPSIRPSLQPSEPPVSRSARIDEMAMRRSDSIGPHTTASLGKHKTGQANRARVHYAVLGCLLGLTAAGTYLFMPRPIEPAAVPVVAPPLSLPLPKPMRQLLLMAEPAHSQIELDGNVVKSNPANISHLDDGQRHRLVVSAPGFIAEEHAVFFNVDRHLTVSLRPTLTAKQSPAPTAGRKYKPAPTAPHAAAVSPQATSTDKARALDRQNPF